MIDPANKPVFLVAADADPVVVRVEGRASFQNSAGLRDFITERLAAGKRRFILDCRACLGMDSTFLGVLAGAALEMRRITPPGSVVVARAGTRNLELMRSLGLHRLLTIDSGQSVGDSPCLATALGCQPQTEVEHARMVLEAHENLVAADEANRAKFEDVLAFLRNRVEQK